MLHLQICPYDCRHSLATISNKARDAAASSTSAEQQEQQLLLYLYEAEPEGLARHMLLLVLLFDASLTARERAEMFLELHGNTLLRQRTAEWESKFAELQLQQLFAWQAVRCKCTSLLDCCAGAQQLQHHQQRKSLALDVISQPFQEKGVISQPFQDEAMTRGPLLRLHTFKQYQAAAEQAPEKLLLVFPAYLCRRCKQVAGSSSSEAVWQRATTTAAEPCAGHARRV
jgi:hypothetical protein